MADLPITRLTSLQMEPMTLAQVDNLDGYTIANGGTLNGTIVQSAKADGEFALLAYAGDILQPDGTWDREHGQFQAIATMDKVPLPDVHQDN